MAVFYDELYCEILRVHVCHLLLETVISHDSGREDDGQVLGRHLIHLLATMSAVDGDLRGCVPYQVLPLSTCYSSKMEHEEFETIAMLLGEHVDRVPQVIATLRLVLDGYRYMVSKVQSLTGSTTISTYHWTRGSARRPRK